MSEHFAPFSPLLDTATLSRIFGVTPTTIRRWRAAGKLPAVRVGRDLRFRRADVERLLAMDAGQAWEPSPVRESGAEHDAWLGTSGPASKHRAGGDPRG